MLRNIRWSGLAVVVGALVLTVVCLVAALRGRIWAVVPGLVCAATALREVRALRRIDRAAGRGAARGGRI